MDIKTVSTYRQLEQQAINQSKKRAFSHETVHKNNISTEPQITPKDIKTAQPTCKTKGLDYYA